MECQYPAVTLDYLCFIHPLSSLMKKNTGSHSIKTNNQSKIIQCVLPQYYRILLLYNYPMLFLFSIFLFRLCLFIFSQKQCFHTSAHDSKLNNRPHTSLIFQLLCAAQTQYYVATLSYKSLNCSSFFHFAIFFKTYFIQACIASHN